MKAFLLWVQKPFKWAHLSPGVNRFFKILDVIIAGINKNIAVFGLVIGVLIVAVNVVTRFISGFYPEVYSLTWGEEVSSYCFIWSALFGAAYGFRKGVHISVMISVKYSKSLRFVFVYFECLFFAFYGLGGIFGV